MFKAMLDYIECDICGRVLRFSPHLTFEDYVLPESFVLEDIDKIVDGIINDYLIFECDVCHVIKKLNFKEIEYIVRKNISKKVIDLKARGVLVDSKYKDRVLIFCGKCSGFDSKGSCFIDIYNSCKIKRFPIGL